MHIEVTPRRFEVTPGIPQAVTVTISNTGSVIGGYAVRVLGADPSWVAVDDPEISLFPDESRAFVVRITVPAGMTAGERRFSIQVRELTPPESSTVEEIVIVVPEAPEVRARVDPMAVTAGRTARLNLLLDNTGNTPVLQRLHGQDPEGRVRFRFDPEIVRIDPGEHALVDVRATAKQPFLGNLAVRPLELRLVDPDLATAPPPEDDEKADEKDGKDKLAAPRFRRRRKSPPRIDDEVPVLVLATFIQKPMVSRGPISLLGLLLAVTVFAVVITLALSQIVGQSAADRNLALEIAAARDGGTSTGASGLSGTVTLLTSGAPVPGVAVSIFSADDTEVPLATTATSKSGQWSVGKLAAGDYKVTFRGAGFVQMWYPKAVAADDGETVTLESGNQRAGLDVALGGVPATISGTVSGPDVSAATLTLKAPLTPTAITPTVGTPAGTTADAGSTAAAGQGATVMSVPIGDDGTFTLENVPSPSVYDLVVEKQGYAASAQRVDVSAGEKRTGVEITLRQGDGVITGVVDSVDGPLGGATVVATAGQTTATTMTLTEGDIGAFTIRGLPTPASFVLVISKPGYTPQTLNLWLSEGQRMTGVGSTLGKSSGVLTGGVLTQSDQQPASGVLVSVTNGVDTVQTATSSAEEDLGEWTVTGLTLPGEYTITFSRDDLQPQTSSVSLDPQGNVTSGILDPKDPDRRRLSLSLRSATATISGLVEQLQRVGPAVPVGEATVTLSTTTTSYTVTTASVPARAAGRWRLEGIPPDSYTLTISRNGVTPDSYPVELEAGDRVDRDTTLAVAASVSGTVVVGTTAVKSGWVVELYRSSGYGDVVYRRTRTDANGQFRFDDVDAPEAYIIQVRRTVGAAASGSQTVEVRASQPASVTVRADNDG